MISYSRQKHITPSFHPIHVRRSPARVVVVSNISERNRRSPQLLPPPRSTSLRNEIVVSHNRISANVRRRRLPTGRRYVIIIKPRPRTSGECGPTLPVRELRHLRNSVVSRHEHHGEHIAESSYRFIDRA